MKKTSKADFWDTRFLLLSAGFVVFIIVIFFFPYLFTSRQWFKIDFRQTGEIGDTLGGIMSPFIGIAAAGLTFIAFWVQYKANEEQRGDIQVERFENKFYELLQLHKENVKEFNIEGKKGNVQMRKAFVSMFNELRYTYWCCKDVYDTIKCSYSLPNYSDEQLIRLAYIFFYSGIGDNSDVMSKAMNVNDNPTKKFDDVLFDEVLKYLKEMKATNSKERKEFKDSDGNKVILKLKYLPWGGHQSRLGHYYRHLFQTVKFVVKQEKSLLEKDEKLEYLKTLRAQLSDHEQLMLYYNALAGFGSAWIDKKNDNKINYFTDYYMIHNIPLPLANFGIRPEIKFKSELEKDKKLFEWLDE